MLWIFYIVVLALLVVQILVVVKMFQNEGALKGILGLICGLYAFIWGWMNANRLGIKNLMLAWTALLILAIILNVFVLGTGAAGGYGTVPVPVR